MSKNLSVKRTLFTGTLLLTTAGILSRFIGFFYKIFLSRTIGAEGLGIYQLIFPVMALCFSLTSAGIQTSVSRFVSSEIGKQNPAGARFYLLIGLILSVCLSVFTGLFMWNHSEFIAGSFLQETRCAPLIKILSFCYVPCSIHSCINGYYYGLKKALVPSLSQLAEQSARVGGVYLIYLVAQSNGRSIAISDAVWGLVLGEFAGMLVSLSFIGFGACKGNIRKTTWSLLTMSFPLTLNRLTLNLFTTIENLLIPYQLKLFGYSSSDALSIYGILTGMAFAIIMFPTVLTNSISVLLLPVVSEAQAKHNDRLIRESIIKTTESCLLLGLLCTIGLFGSRLILSATLFFKNALSATFYRYNELDLPVSLSRKHVKQYFPRTWKTWHHSVFKPFLLPDPYPFYCISDPGYRYQRLPDRSFDQSDRALRPCFALALPPDEKGQFRIISRLPLFSVPIKIYKFYKTVFPCFTICLMLKSSSTITQSAYLPLSILPYFSHSPTAFAGFSVAHATTSSNGSPASLTVNFMQLNKLVTDPAIAPSTVRVALLPCT